MSENWLAELKAGDAVVVDASKYGGFDQEVRTVARTTATQIVVEDVYRGSGEKWVRRFRKSDGFEVGTDGDWNRTLLREATPEAIAQIEEYARRHRALTRVGAQRWNALSTDQLERIVAILDEGQS